MATRPAYGGPICSLCCTLNPAATTVAKIDARAGNDQVRLLLERLLAGARSRPWSTFRVAHYPWWRCPRSRWR